MDFIDPILSVASQIYTLVENVKANKKSCRFVASQVKDLEGLVRSIKKKKTVQTSADVEQALKELKITLESAEVLIKKYTLANWRKRFLKYRRYKDDFSSLQERLAHTRQVLHLALQVDDLDQGNMVLEEVSRMKALLVDQVDQGNMVLEEISRMKEDRRADDAELKELLLEYKKKVPQETANVDEAVEMLNKLSITDEVIRTIKLDELIFDIPKEPFITTPTSEIYRGQYRGFTVAIKRYINTVNTNLREVKSVFKREVETMRRFESPNILRMFGICVQDEDGPSPQFLIVMEYCEKGSLRQVLDSERELTWTDKARLCLDAAQGLYRLHQTEEKSKVHGCINSSTFLVAEYYRVKLGGFELAKTESSLRRSPKDNQSSSLCYSSPERLSDLEHDYSKECEMYSFGIILWEIATRRRPFEGLSIEEIYQKVCEERYQEPLPDDCPEPLGRLIDACRAYDSFQRPSAGVLMDELRKVVIQLEEE